MTKKITSEDCKRALGNLIGQYKDQVIGMYEDDRWPENEGERIFKSLTSNKGWKRIQKVKVKTGMDWFCTEDWVGKYPETYKRLGDVINEDDYFLFCDFYWESILGDREKDFPVTENMFIRLFEVTDDAAGHNFQLAAVLTNETDTKILFVGVDIG